MDRRAFLRAAGLSGGVLLAGCASNGGTGSPEDTTDSPPTDTTTDPTTTPEPTASEPTTTPSDAPTAALSNGGFESGLDAWTTGRDVPTDPNTGDPVETDVSVTEERAADGERALALTIDGSQDDGTVWVEQGAPLDEFDTLAFDVYSPTESANTRLKVAAYTGPDADLRESDFGTERAADGHEGWETFEYDVSHDGDGIAAVGVSVVWETTITGIIDSVRLLSSGE